MRPRDSRLMTERWIGRGPEKEGVGREISTSQGWAGGGRMVESIPEFICSLPCGPSPSCLYQHSQSTLSFGPSVLDSCISVDLIATSSMFT